MLLQKVCRYFKEEGVKVSMARIIRDLDAVVFSGLIKCFFGEKGQVWKRLGGDKYACCVCYQLVL